jgi:hypothetical protein
MHSLTDPAIARHALLLLGFFSLTSCEPSTGYPPVARIDVAPRAIPENDGFQSEVVLDAQASADPIDDPEGTRGLSYRWQIIGDEFRLISGSLSGPTLTISLLGETPATVLLTVTDEDDNSNTAREQLQLTVRP